MSPVQCIECLQPDIFQLGDQRGKIRFLMLKRF